MSLHSSWPAATSTAFGRQAHAWTPPTAPVVAIDLGGVTISVSRDGDQWLAVEVVTSLYGEGDDPFEAAFDLRASMFELLHELEDQQSRVSPEIEAKREFLRRVLPL